MQYVTKKHLSRRAVLRGVGAALSLPLLDSMVPAQTPVRKTVAASSPTRLACIEMVHGAAGSTGEGTNKHYWSPEKTGNDFEFTQTLQPLEATPICAPPARTPLPRRAPTISVRAPFT
jgi:hypothetical protein